MPLPPVPPAQEAAASGQLEDPLPPELLQFEDGEAALPGLLPALRAMHDPASEEEREVRYRRRLAVVPCDSWRRAGA